MAYNTKELKASIIEAINKYKLISISDICRVCKLGTTTFYDHFPKKQEELKEGELSRYDEIVRLLNKNKVDIGLSIRHKWHKSDNFPSQIALYKLVCDDDERKKLSQQYTELTGKDGGAIEIQFNEQNIDNLEKDENTGENS